MLMKTLEGYGGLQVMFLVLQFLVDLEAHQQTWDWPNHQTNWCIEKEPLGIHLPC